MQGRALHIIEVWSSAKNNFNVIFGMEHRGYLPSLPHREAKRASREGSKESSREYFVSCLPC